MSPPPKDRVQREIEEILDKLDTFVPEERFTAKMRARQRTQTAERDGPSVWQRLTRPLTNLTLGHLMLAGIAVFAIAYLFDDQLGSWSVYLLIAGVLLTGSALLFSIINGGNTRIRVGSGGKVQKRWRGQVIEYHEPGPLDRVRGWFRRRKGG